LKINQKIAILTSSTRKKNCFFSSFWKIAKIIMQNKKLKLKSKQKERKKAKNTQERIKRKK
jgi:hypothetical protein